MSTAGKVLVALILLSSLVWVTVAAGVAQLNRNGNAAMAKLADDYVKTQEGLTKAQEDIVKVKDQTTVFQEGVDVQLAVIRSRLYTVEGDSSRLKELVNRFQYQLDTVQNTVKAAEQLREQRTAEKHDEEKALADSRGEVQELMAKSQELTARLESLRKEFKSTFDSNVGMVAHSVR